MNTVKKWQDRIPAVWASQVGVKGYGVVEGAMMSEIADLRADSSASVEHIKKQNEAIANLVLEVAAEKQRADELQEQAKQAAAAVQAEQARYEALAQELASHKSAIVTFSLASAQPLPKWIDNEKGKDPFTDRLISYIEQLRGDQPLP